MPKKLTGTLAVREGEDPWTDAEIAEVRQELDNDVARLTAELDHSTRELTEILREGVDVAGNDEADVGSTSLERDSELSLAANQNELLMQTKLALERLDAGTYGDCGNCGNAIGKARLQAYPRATLCIACKQLEERR